MNEPVYAVMLPDGTFVDQDFGASDFFDAAAFLWDQIPYAVDGLENYKIVYLFDTGHNVPLH